MKDPAFEVFNRGVTLSLDAQQMREEGDADGAMELEAQSLEAFDQAIQMNPDHVGTIGGKALCLAQLGRPDEAAEWFRKAIDLEPGFAENHKQLGICLFQIGDLAGGRDSIILATQVNTDPQYRQHTAIEAYNLGAHFMRCAAKSRDDNETEREFQSVFAAQAAFTVSRELDPTSQHTAKALRTVHEILGKPAWAGSRDRSRPQGILGKIRSVFRK